MTKHIVSIYEYPRRPLSGRFCRVRVSVDGVPRGGTRLIRDPFWNDKSPHEKDIRHGYTVWYLEDALSKDNFDQTEADKYAAYLHRYRIDLYNNLGISDDISGFDRNCTVEINIFAYPASTKSLGDPRLRMSILEFYWELLELIPTDPKKNRNHHAIEFTNVWPKRVTSVSVKRILPKQPFSNSVLSLGDIPRTVSWSEIRRDEIEVGVDMRHECRVLLVIARKLLMNGQYEISPSFIECALLRLFEGLNAAIGREFYQLEVVRPGSFEELRDHLARHPERPFQIVHFDMHGIVRCQKPDCGLPRNVWRPDDKERICRTNDDEHIGRAFLIFAALNDQGHLEVSEHAAEDIAVLLNEYHVQCVALNACESARTNDGVNSNLTHTFIYHGISNVIAMSFRISDLMFVTYYEKFYEDLFDRCNRFDFAQAASNARKKLQIVRERRDAYNDRIDMDDWFVPVTYCNETVIRMPVPEPDDLQDAHSYVGGHHWRSWLQLGNTTKFVLKLTSVTAVISCWTTILFKHRKEIVNLASWALLPPVIAVASWYMSKLSGTLLSLRYVKCPAAKELDEDMLDNNMLRIEGELRNHKPLVLHGLSKIPETLSLIDNLSFVWGRTKFIDLVIIIPAAWFYQPAPIQQIRRWCCKLAHQRHCCHGVKSQDYQGHPPDRTMVIITDLELIFPQEPSTQLNLLQQFLHETAQQRLVSLLERYFKDEEETKNYMKDEKNENNNTPKIICVSAGGKKPYLFLSGSASLQDRDTLKASFDKLGVVGIRSTDFDEIKEYRFRTAIIQEHMTRN